MAGLQSRARGFPVGMLIATLVLCPPAMAAGPPASGLGEEWVPVSTERLDDLRGGFSLPDGPMVSFGIERVVRINGELVATLSLQIPDVRRIDAGQAQALAEFQRGILVQVGPGNSANVTPGMGGVIIQNTLDNQSISTSTRIDVGVDTLGLYKALNLTDTLTNALTGSYHP